MSTVKIDLEASTKRTGHISCCGEATWDGAVPMMDSPVMEQHGFRTGALDESAWRL